MTYESLMIANQTITKIEVKGKEYAEVNQRIRVFRMLYPNGSIETNIESLEKGICVMSAVVKDDFGSVLGVGHAYEKEDSSFINKTSYIENPAAVYCDIRKEELTGIWKSGDGQSERTCYIDPDIQCDFTDLPFPDETFSLVVFDPPHLKYAGKTG